MKTTYIKWPTWLDGTPKNIHELTLSEAAEQLEQALKKESALLIIGTYILDSAKTELARRQEK